MTQLPFVCAVLGGFAFAFLGALITIEKPSKVLSATLFVTAIAAGLLLIATLGTTMYAGVIAGIREGRSGQEVINEIYHLRKPLSLMFLSGGFMLIVSIGLVGWVRSKNLGIAMSTLALLIAFGAWFVMKTFIH